MRTTLTLDDDVAAEVERLRRKEGLGPSGAVNKLARAGMAGRPEQPAFRQRTAAIGFRVDVTNIGEVLGMLDDA